ncbi:serine/threonine protein kinase [Nesterenkonia sp. PF2B19]|uniref:serine/threonine protein kinase n=1 Tax=Nesterenkonia sp. PF2B19 TaxID=1881858 RepID=UPI000871D405|nr:protein kinase [Nesterenkonia sp. PF2B19]
MISNTTSGPDMAGDDDAAAGHRRAPTRTPTRAAPRRGAPPEAEGLSLRRLLGLGGSSTVWLAEVTGDGPHWADAAPADRTVAVKIRSEAHGMGQSLESGAGAWRSAELNAVRRLHHEHLVTVYGWTDTSAGPGLILEPYTAGSLGRLLAARGTLSVGETVTVLSPVAQALAHLHAAGVAHGDVSPGNVLLAPDGRPALGDLGDAQLLGASPIPAATQGFAAPERTSALRSAEHGRRQRAWDASLAPEADVYGLAAVAWCSLTGSAPAVGRRRPPLGTLCPEAPSRLIRLLEEALSEAADERPDARAFAAELHRCAAPEPLDLAAYVDDDVLPELPTVRPGARERGVTRRRRQRLVAGISAAVLLLGLGAATLSEPRQDGLSPDDEDVFGAGLGERVPDDTSEPGDGEPGDSEPSDGRTGDGRTDPAAESGQPSGAEAERLLRQDDPLMALDGLAMLRTSALQNPGEPDVQRYVVAGSPAEASEKHLMEQMHSRGQAHDSARMEILPVGEAEYAPDPGASAAQGETAHITAEIRIDGLDDGAGREQTVRLVLHRTEVGWRLHTVQDVGTPNTSGRHDDAGGGEDIRPDDDAPRAG